MVKNVRRVIIIVLISLVTLAFIGFLASEIRHSMVRDRYQGTTLDRVQTIEVNDLTLAYRVWGEGNAETVVLVHGFMGSSYDFRYLALDLARRYKVIALDLPGFGLSDKPVDYTYTGEQHKETLYAFIDALELESVHLGGHSMGGDIALRYAHDFPETLDSLMLFASAGFNEPTSGRGQPLFFYEFVFKNYYAQRFAFNTVYYQDTYQTSDYYDLMAYFNQGIPARTIQAFSNDQDTNKSFDLAENIEVKTLIIYGEEDTWTPKVHGIELDALLPNSLLIILPHTGHLPFIESRNATNAAVQAFLQDLKTP